MEKLTLPEQNVLLIQPQQTRIVVVTISLVKTATVIVAVTIRIVLVTTEIVTTPMLVFRGYTFW